VSPLTIANRDRYEYDKWAEAATARRAPLMGDDRPHREEGYRTRRGRPGTHRNGRPPSAHQGALLTLLADGDLSTSQIAEVLEVNKGVAYRLAKRAQIRGLVSGRRSEDPVEPGGRAHDSMWSLVPDA
jgi:hypothetical protein